MHIKPDLTVTIVGPGRVGQAMGRLLVEAGVPIKYVAGRKTARAKHAARFVGGAEGLKLKDRRLADADVILITTSDTALSEVAEQIAQYRKDWSGHMVLHTCGSLPAAVLEPFRKRGASVASMHPYQTVPDAFAGVRSLPGSFWTIEGDPEAVELARRWVAKLNGIAIDIKPENKPLYHLSAFLVSPTVVTLMGCSERLLEKSGMPRKYVRQMLGKFVSETVRNFVALSTRRSLTGPAVRGDWATLERHIAELQREAPEVVPAYIELVDLMLRAAGATPEQRQAVERLRALSGRSGLQE
ncbi:MAG TPA: Rossmann-like and DUF2520 domain-containing protein [Terriglobia bacterium]|nr:Rossmann-like and DUF2520 domain-containing protein [Terriglobia bacterium]